MKKIRSCVRLGIVLSIAWTAFASFIYFTEIYYCHSAKWRQLTPITKGEMLGPLYAEYYGLFHNNFTWNDCEFQTWNFLGTKEAPITDGRSAKMCIFKPTFSIFGYLKLMFLPIILVWLGLLIWVRRQYLIVAIRSALQALIEKFMTSDIITKYFIIMSVYLSMLVCFVLMPLMVVDMLDCGFYGFPPLIVFCLCCIAGIMIAIALAWLIVYGLFYAAIKGLKDANK